MKLFCFLMALVLANVLAVTELEYKTQVYKTNFYFGRIAENENRLDLTIENFIRSDIPITRLNMMLVVPESPLNSFVNDFIPPIYEADEGRTQRRITSDHIIFGAPDTSPDRIWNMDWQELGKNRRNITNPSFARLLKKVESGSHTRLNNTNICLLIGLYANGLVPNAPTHRVIYTNAVVNDGHNDCHLIHNSDHVSIFRKFNDGFWKVKADYSPDFKLILP